MRSIGVAGISKLRALHFLYIASVVSIGEDLTYLQYYRLCAQSDIRVMSGLCNGTTFSIRACEFNGLRSPKIKKFESGVSVIEALTINNCTDEVDRACKGYFAESQVHFPCYYQSLYLNAPRRTLCVLTFKYVR